MIRCNPEVKKNCTDGALCEGTYAGENCYCGRMNRKAKASVDFINDILNAVHNAVLDGEFLDWEDLCVELHVPEVIATGYDLTVWGEEDENEDRYFSVWIFWNAHKGSFTIHSTSNSDDDLFKAVAKAIDRMIQKIGNEAVPSDSLDQ